MRREDDRRRRQRRVSSLFALVVLGARGVVGASLNHHQNEDQKSSFSVDDIDTAPKLTADFESEDVARAIDVVMFEGPAYEGCCPMHGDGDGDGDDEGEGELLACCRTGGCCPSTEPGGGYGKHLACCESDSGSEEENRGKSRVWYSGPSYDGCCPNEDGENLTCCGEEDGCCPADGAKRHSCCPDIAGGVANDGGGYDDDDDGDASYSSPRAEDLGQYDDGEVDAVQGEESGSGGDDGGVASYWTRKRLDDDETASSTETVDTLDDASTVYLQLAAMGCVVVWIVALVVSGVYAKRDGRGGEDERLLPNF